MRSAGPQQAALYGKLTAAENLRLFARLERAPDVEGAVTRMLDQAAWPTVHTTRSASEQPPAAESRSPSSEPPVLLLDEPSAALDPRQRERLWEFVGEPTEAGTTIVYSTHNVQEAERHAHQVVVPADGERLFSGSPGGSRRSSARATGLRGGIRRLPPPARPLSRGSHALAVREGPADPAPVAAPPHAARPLPDHHRRADRVRALPRTGGAACRLPEPGPSSPRTRLPWGARRSMPPLRGAALRRDRAGARLEPRGGDQDGGGRRRPRRPDHPAGHNAEARGWTGAGVDRGLLQRRGSGEAGVRREHDRVGGGGRERGATQPACRGGAGLHRRTDRRRAVRLPGQGCAGLDGTQRILRAREEGA